MDVAIAIRTAIVKDGMLYVQAGRRGGRLGARAGMERKPNTRRVRCCAAELVEEGLE